MWKERFSDRELLDLLEHDPQTGMEAAVEQFTGLLWKIGEMHLENPEDIKECINDVFLELYTHRDRFDSEKGTLTAYLAQIMRNLAISCHRKNILWKNQPPAHIDESASDQNMVELQVDLERAMASLKPEDAEIIRMKYYGGMTVGEIAARLNLPYEAVKKRHQRSLSRLRRLLLGLLVMGLLALLAACAYTLLRYFGIIPGYGVSSDPKSPAFILEEPVRIEDDSGAYPGIYLIHDAVLLNDQMYIMLDYQPANSAIMEKMTWDDADALQEFGSEIVNAPVTLNGASYGRFLFSWSRESSLSETVGFWSIMLKLESLEPETIPQWEDGIEVDFSPFGLDIRCRLVQVKAGQVSEYSHQLEHRGGLLAIPQLEEGHLVIGIYPLNTGRETLLTYLLWGYFHEGGRGNITVDCPDGQELVGECDYSSSYNSEYFYNWNFGPAQPGQYTLHVPYVCLTAPLEKPVTFCLNLQQGTWDDQKLSVPGGTLFIESCQPMEVPLGEPSPGRGGPFTVQEDTRLWTLRMRYEPLEDLVMTGCLLAPAAEMEVQGKVFYDIITDEQGNYVPLNASGLICTPVSYGEEDNIVEMVIEGHDGCFDPSHVLLTLSEPLSMRWEHSFDLPLTVGIGTE